QLKEIVRKAIEHKALMKEIHQLRQALQKNYNFDNIIGRSPKMQDVFRLIRMVASSQATVLIEGESGTGKELVAKAVHFSGQRRDKPFVDANCAAIPANLLESEFFGHEKGAFTGAISRRIGRFEQANGGTLFLDEVGEIELPLQVKLLRAIQERKFERVGGNSSVSVDIRLIAATNRDLKESVKEGRFREDLYFRLNVIKITLPPLRERREDIPLLVEHFLKKYAEQERKNVNSVSPEAMKQLLDYHWPGNVRELENTMERALVICQGNTITSDELPYEMTLSNPSVSSGGMVMPAENACNLSEMEREMIVRALEKTRGNKSKAAGILGISRKVLYARLKEYEIDL
ncbi:MAG: sigma-54 dependent transcriptional regulator, partial [Nitrospirota bacterium]|nr:sigma-54 dependent transcriptional regulator [Nitrospirota bacterium]